MAVSDEAMFSLDGAGNVSHDFFYSAFDAMIHVGHLRMQEAVSLLRARAIGLPDPFLWLCHCLSGGLPRELIRIARGITEIGGEFSAQSLGGKDDLTTVSRQIVGDELAHNVNIVRVAAGAAGEGLGDSIAGLLESSGSRPPKFADLLTLIEIAAAIPVEEDLRMSSGAASQNNRMAALAQLYQYATVLEAFEAASVHVNGSELLRAAHGDAIMLEKLNILGASRPLLSVEPGLGWALISSFRSQWGMKAYDLPIFHIA